MKLVVQVKLLPSPEQAAALHATLHTCNALADRVSGTAYCEGVFSRAGLQRLVYAELKAAGLSAQPALHVIRKTADAYTTLHAQIDAGLLGPQHSKRRRRAESKPIAFRPDAAQPFDDRCLSWQYDARTVSIWTTAGRLRGIAFTGGPSHLKRLTRRKQREARHATDQNHKISKQIVADAQRNGRGIAVEHLDGIRDRVRLKRHQRATLSSWPFHQLGAFLAYKARRAGVPFLQVDPAYTSQTCPNPWCGHVSRKNRPTRGRFLCVACGLAGPADHIAAVNVRRRARTAWAFVSMPDPHPPPKTRRHKGDATRAPQPVAIGSATRCEPPSPTTGGKLGRSRPRS